MEFCFINKYYYLKESYGYFNVLEFRFEMYILKLVCIWHALRNTQPLFLDLRRNVESQHA